MHLFAIYSSQMILYCTIQLRQWNIANILTSLFTTTQIRSFFYRVLIKSHCTHAHSIVANDSIFSTHYSVKIQHQNMDHNRPQTDCLVEIKLDDLIKLKNLYSLNSPNNILGLSTITNYIRWTEIESNLANFLFYSLNGDLSNGTFVFVVSFNLFKTSHRN